MNDEWRKAADHSVNDEGWKQKIIRSYCEWWMMKAEEHKIILWMTNDKSIRSPCEWWMQKIKRSYYERWMTKAEDHPVNDENRRLKDHIFQKMHNWRQKEEIKYMKQENIWWMMNDESRGSYYEWRKQNKII